MTANDFVSLLPFTIVAGWACALLMVDLFIPPHRKGWTALLAALGLLGALAAVLAQAKGERQAFGGMIVLDGFAMFLQVIFLVAGLFGIALAYDYLKRREIERGEYYSLLLFTVSGMVLMSTAGDLIVVFLALELLSIPLYVMAGFGRPLFESEESAMKYFLLGAFASGFVLYGIALVFGATRSTQLAQVVAASASGEAEATMLLAGVALILVGFGFKVAVVPFHMWTPDVYQGAPSAVTAFMSVGAKAGGFAGLLRVLIAAFPAQAGAWGAAGIALAALTMIWGNVAAIAQPNIKRMLAYSSIAHAGYILMAVPAAADPRVAPEALSSALFYLLAYAATNLGAWGVVLALERAEGKGLAIDDYAGLGAKRPALALAMALFMLSLTGVPPTAGFVAKFYVFRAALDAGLIGLALVGALTSLISAYYYLRVLVVMYMRPGEPEVRSETWLNAAITVAGLATLILGVLPGPFLHLAGQAGLFAFAP